MKKVFIPKKLGKVFNKRTSIEERVVIRELSLYSPSKFTGIFFTRSIDSDIKRAIISKIYSDSDETLEILTSINDCIAYLLSIGYTTVYLSARYILICSVSDLYYEVGHDYILFSKN